MSESAARRYKEITGGMNEAVRRMSTEDAERARELQATLVELRAAMADTAEREALTVLGVQLRWEAAIETLWHEQWMTLRPMPKPDPVDSPVSPGELDYLDAVVMRRLEALREVVRRRSLLGRR